MKTEIDFSNDGQEKCFIHLTSIYWALTVCLVLRRILTGIWMWPRILPISITVTREKGAESGWFLTRRSCGCVGAGRTGCWAKLWRLDMIFGVKSCWFSFTICLGSVLNASCLRGCYSNLRSGLLSLFFTSQSNRINFLSTTMMSPP